MSINTEQEFLFILYIFPIIVLFIIIVIYILYLIFRSPFHYPYFNYYFDVSGKKNPKIEDQIDKFLNEFGIAIINEHKDKIENWKLECINIIKNSVLKNYRMKQYQKCLDDENAFCFHFTRRQTRYKQVNYIKSSYIVTQTVSSYACDYFALLRRNERLKNINHECTLNEYFSKNQRRLMKPELRNQIKIRDNYTCQICGKYMPDEVGLQIDHILSVAKGGKTVESNLQVLCSKCNGKKSSK